jgi:Tfp pilus assembly protein FimT
MAKLIIVIALIAITINVAVPALQSWDMGSSINSVGSVQLAELEE